MRQRIPARIFRSGSKRTCNSPSRRRRRRSCSSNAEPWITYPEYTTPTTFDFPIERKVFSEHNDPQSARSPLRPCAFEALQRPTLPRLITTRAMGSCCLSRRCSKWLIQGRGRGLGGGPEALASTRMASVHRPLRATTAAALRGSTARPCMGPSRFRGHRLRAFHGHSTVQLHRVHITATAHHLRRTHGQAVVRLAFRQVLLPRARRPCLEEDGSYNANPP